MHGSDSPPHTPLAPRQVVIIGGGFSGALMAINLVRHDGPSAILVERRGAFAQGLAYSTAQAGHLLNVRAANMSAFPDKPDDFARWLGIEDEAGGRTFAPRAAYGRYLSQLLEQTHRDAPGRLQLVQDEAVALSGSGKLTVTLRSGSTITADAAILALGNLPPSLPRGIDPAVLGDRYVADPWAGDLAAGLADTDEVLIIGSGLTMVDVALSLEAQGFAGRITALSRRGLLPRVHAEASVPHPALGERPRGELSWLLRAVRQRAQAIGWHLAMDELRPFTQAIWQSADEVRKRRFLRHLRPWWDVHRHRLAPPVAQRIAALRQSGRLTIARGSIRSLTLEGNQVAVEWQTPGAAQPSHAHFARIVNCTGPQSNLARTSEPLLQDLVAHGIAAADPLGLGIAVDRQGRLVGKNGASPNIYALGPMTRGTFWEITSVPDIRRQVWDMARQMSHAHWIEGEGL